MLHEVVINILETNSRIDVLYKERNITPSRNFQNEKSEIKKIHWIDSVVLQVEDK